MKIRTIIYFCLLALISTLILFCGLLMYSYNEITLAAKKHAIANAITNNTSEIRALTFDYILRSGDRARMQWTINYKDLSVLLGSYPQDTSEERTIFTDLNNSYRQLDGIFSQLVATLPPPSDTERLRSTTSLDAQNRLVSELITKTQSMVTNSLKLSDITYAQTILVKNRVDSFVLLTMVILFIMCFGMLILFRKVILLPLMQLEKATHIISEGNLDYVVSVSGNSEVTTLATSFNQMTAKLKALDDIKSEFLKISAHQLRTPLGIMRWNLETVLKEKQKLTGKTKDLLNDTYTNLVRMISLIGQLMIVYQINKGVTKQSTEKILIINTIKENIANSKHEAFRNKVTIQTKFSVPKETKITIERSKLDICMQHLLSNAIIYSKKSGGKVTVSVSEENRMINITIEDNGIGIPQKEMAHVFTRFYRGSNATLQDPNGNGLGLFVVKSYVEEAGGQVKLTSIENKGTTVTILLPKRI